EMQDGGMVRFRCHVGHAYTADSMLADQSDALERALWASFRALEERSELMRRLAARAREHQHHRSSSHFDQVVKETEQHVALIRQVLESYDSQDLIEDISS